MGFCLLANRLLQNETKAEVRQKEFVRRSAEENVLMFDVQMDELNRVHFQYAFLELSAYFGYVFRVGFDLGAHFHRELDAGRINCDLIPH